jgi:hypothetical protein
MARITRVRKAQQRYATKPVLGEDGQPLRTPVMGKNGEQKTSKRGPVFMAVTVADKTKPLPNEKCGKCGVEIKPGDPYKHISPKSGPYGGRRLVRCDSCPDWFVWDYSSSMSARVAQMAYNCEQEIEGCEDPESVKSALSAMAEEVKELAGEKRESASNIEEGFGHPTSASEELESVADQLDDWATEVEDADVPETDEYTCQTCMGDGEEACSECDEGTATSTDGTGTGKCENCDGTGRVQCSECEAEEDYVDLDAWRAAVQDDVSIINECPV